MARDETTIAEVIAELQKRSRVSYRLMLHRVNDAWSTQAMLADTEVNSTAHIIHDYGYVAFIAGISRGDRLASWLKRRKGRAAGFNFTVPQLQDRVFSDRYPSQTRREIFLSLPQPHSVHRIYVPGRTELPRSFDPLVKSGCPSFPSLGDAAYRFLYDLPYQSGQREPDDIVVRVVHTEAWLELIHLHRNGVTLSVSGTQVGGTRVELRGDSEVLFDTTLRKPGQRRFSFPNGLPNRLWVLLSRGDRWLDYRDLDLRGNRASAEAGVLIDAPDPCEQIGGLILRGESETREFKREIPKDKNNTFLKTVAAFANGSGGVIVFGVADDTGEIRGIRGDLQHEKDRLINLIRDNLVPQPNCRPEICKLKGKDVIALFIEEGSLPPYGLDAAKPRFYIRRGATTFPATQAEIRAFVRKTDSRIEEYPFSRLEM